MTSSRSSFSSWELGRLNWQMSLSHNDCPICGNPVVAVKKNGVIEQRCSSCSWEGPSVTMGGIKSFDENYY
jgi:hypothetical protein